MDLPIQQRIDAGTLISETDAMGTILFVNNGFCQLSQYSLWELIGQPHSIVRHPDMPRRLFEVMWEALTSDNVFRGVLKNRAKDGSHFWIHLTIVPTYGRRVQKIRFIGSGYQLSSDQEAEVLYHEQAKLLDI